MWFNSPFVFSIVERTSSEEFAEEGGGRQPEDGDGFDVGEELAQAVGFAVFFRVLRHLFQQWQCLFAQGGELKE